MKDVAEIVVGANGTIRFAPVGTAAPASEAAVVDAAWVDAGYASEDGVTFTDAKTLEEIPVWQLFGPARRIVSARDVTVAFALRQWSGPNLKFALGGGTITAPSPGHFKYVPPDPEDVDEKALMIDWADGTKLYRLVLIRGMVTENVETNLVRTAAADLPITFALNWDDAGDSWYLLTNDPAFDPA